MRGAGGRRCRMLRWSCVLAVACARPARTAAAVVRPAADLGREPADDLRRRTPARRTAARATWRAAPATRSTSRHARSCSTCGAATAAWRSSCASVAPTRVRRSSAERRTPGRDELHQRLASARRTSRPRAVRLPRPRHGHRHACCAAGRQRLKYEFRCGRRANSTDRRGSAYASDGSSRSPGRLACAVAGRRLADRLRDAAPGLLGRKRDRQPVRLPGPRTDSRWRLRRSRPLSSTRLDRLDLPRRPRL